MPRVKTELGQTDIAGRMLHEAELVPDFDGLAVSTTEQILVASWARRLARARPDEGRRSRRGGNAAAFISVQQAGERFTQELLARFEQDPPDRCIAVESPTAGRPVEEL